VELLDTIPGVGRQTAEMIVSEIGADMRRFPSAAHLAAWAFPSSWRRMKVQANGSQARLVKATRHFVPA